MQKLVWIAAAGAVGSVLRYLVAGWGQRLANGSFPVGTMITNVTGCLLIGSLAALFADRVLVREVHRTAVMIGFLGGYTTFSSFGLETFALMNDGQFLRATANVVVSVVLGLTAVWVGYRLVEYWVGV